MVYVDMLINYGARGWKYSGTSCHLLADTVDELHEFAEKIGMKREWVQMGAGGVVPHYDLTANKRKQAVKNGAVEIGRDEVIKMIQAFKAKKQS